MTQVNRLDGGLIDRNTPLSFTFDGRRYDGFAGDTLASALVANGVRLVGRSFKYHRPRGIISAGSEEPNGLVELRTGARREPNSRATMTELHDGLVAASQNRFPSLGFDLMAVNDRLSNFLGAGFYYKTFMWPKSFWERVYEPIIRRAAGLGALSGEDDPDVYDRGFRHCDLLVIGAGPAGLSAALTAGRAGAEVILVDEDFRAGGRLLQESFGVGGMPGADWAANVVAELQSLANVRLMPRSTAIGVFDHGIYAVLERTGDHIAAPDAGKPRQILWRVYAKRSLLCAGATERLIGFADNDRPGIMQAGAVRGYVNRFAATPAEHVAVFTNNDDGHRTAADLAAAGVDVTAIIDSRPDAPESEVAEVFAGAVVSGTGGRLGLGGVDIRLAAGARKHVQCGALAVSGGWNPNVHLTCHHRGRPSWQDDISAFVPGTGVPPGMAVAGAARGVFSTAGAIGDGQSRAVAQLAEIGIAAAADTIPEAEDAPVRITPLWHVPGKKRAWLDQQNDVTVKDVKLAHQENFRAVEHLKRYTTLGMAGDQGRTSNVLGLAIMAELTGKSIAETGTTIYRPPYTPTPIAAFAGRSVGPDFRPTRLTPSHHWAAEQGATFVEAGAWLRAQWFPREGETHWRESVDREVLATRASVGVCDVSTLGKIDIQGSDAGAFLDLAYSNTFSTLPVGKTRYGLMLREDGMVMDDGTTARLGEMHYVMTTTTANAGGVYRHLEFLRQCLRPGMDVQLISATDSWAQFAVAGPNARRVLQELVDPRHDISNEGFPFMACGEISVCGGVPARLFRISFSGELAYEIAVPSRYGDSMIRALMAAGEPWDITPYGTEALGVMRIEKGHVTGNELNGTITARNLGMAKMVSAKKDSIGAVLAGREALVAEDGLCLVGLQALDGGQVIAGSHLFDADGPVDAAHDRGYVTSAAYSPHVGASLGLGFITRGGERHGEIVRAMNPLEGRSARVRICSPHFIDPEGERLRG
ncbi:MAG: sarcosine oxidase subunit alpha family protein [Pseudomonadota bacterium]|nr:sarcosine oxidase subunit alpha family protein [Pseudomonadota bacterium]